MEGAGAQYMPYVGTLTRTGRIGLDYIDTGRLMIPSSTLGLTVSRHPGPDPTEK